MASTKQELEFAAMVHMLTNLKDNDPQATEKLNPFVKYLHDISDVPPDSAGNEYHTNSYRETLSEWEDYAFTNKKQREGFNLGNARKYLRRYMGEGQKAANKKDLYKAIHYILMEL